jgi:hypothetical protein
VACIQFADFVPLVQPDRPEMATIQWRTWRMAFAGHRSGTCGVSSGPTLSRPDARKRKAGAHPGIDVVKASSAADAGLLNAASNQSSGRPTVFLT